MKLIVCGLWFTYNYEALCVCVCLAVCVFVCVSDCVHNNIISQPT